MILMPDMTTTMPGRIMTTTIDGESRPFVTDSPREPFIDYVAGMHDLIERESQFVIATHSPIIMAYPDSLIYHFDSEGIQEIPYEDTEHYRVTRAFLMRREQMLRELFTAE